MFSASMLDSLAGLVLLDDGLAFGLGLFDCDLLACLKTGGVYVFAATYFLAIEGGGGGGGGIGIIDAFCL